MQLPKQTTGPLAGYATLTVNIGKLIAYYGSCVAHAVKYGLGAKDPHPGTFPPRYGAIDCSGFVRTILAYATAGQSATYGMPDGSWMEDNWFKVQGFKPASYQDCANKDGHVRVAIHRPNGRGGDSTGHIWLVYNGESLESYGGHGPGRRPWDHQWFVDHVDDCYVIS